MGHAAVLLSGRRIAAGRTLAVATASALALIAVLLLGASSRPHTAAVAHLDSSLAAKGAISNSLGREQRAFYATSRRGGLIADNAAQRLTTHFGTSGVLVRSGATTFGLQLLAWGAPGHTTPVAPAAPRANANRVSYVHGPVTEWYANGPLGLEQGFDVRTPPVASARDQLTIVLGLRGNANARADGHGGLLLTGPGNQRLTYSGLSAVDARGRKLGTSLTTSGGRALIHVDTAGAVYPLRIDPFIQVQKFGESNPGATMQAAFGNNGISVAGTTAAVSVTLNNTSPASGAVDIFVANAGRWERGATMVAQLTDDDSQDGFATSLSLSADGRTLAVGAPEVVFNMNPRGAVFVFTEPAAVDRAVVDHPPLGVARLGPGVGMKQIDEAQRSIGHAPEHVQRIPAPQPHIGELPVANVAERGRDAIEERLGADETVVRQHVGAIGEMLARPEADLEMERTILTEQ